MYHLPPACLTALFEHLEGKLHPKNSEKNDNFEHFLHLNIHYSSYYEAILNRIFDLYSPYGTCEVVKKYWGVASSYRGHITLTKLIKTRFSMGNVNFSQLL